MRLSTLPLFLLAPFAVGYRSTDAQSTAAQVRIDDVHRPNWSSPSMASQETAADLSSGDIQAARRERFRDRFREQIDDPSKPKLGTTTSIYRISIAPLPVAQSDLIVEAKPTSVSAHWATNRSAVYTELTLNIEKVYLRRKQSPDSSQITVLYHGGYLKSSRTGEVFGSDLASGSTPLDIGMSYVLFLRYNAQTDSYHILRAWDIQDSDHAFLLNENGNRSVSHSEQNEMSAQNLSSSIANKVQVLKEAK